jgi:hypothetical protein
MKTTFRVQFNTKGKPDIGKRIRRTGSYDGAVCTVASCNGVARIRGWCIKHYTRWLRHGNVNAVFRSRDWNGRCRACGRKGVRFHGPLSRICVECRAPVRKAWRAKNIDRDREIGCRSQMKAHYDRRAKILEHYGSKCACCGESEPAFLAVDHIGGGGNKHRRELKALGYCGSHGFYRWIVENNFPDSLRLLCHNCNFADGHGGCPHQRGRKEAA